jgi:hypothetical protein
VLRVPFPLARIWTLQDTAIRFLGRIMQKVRKVGALLSRLASRPRPPLKALFLIALSTLMVDEIALATSAKAATGDTNISIHYRSKSVRVRPSPRTGGANVDFRIVLRANGKVEDEYSVKDGKRGSSKSKLGPADRGAIYRVLDSGTITRTVDVDTHYHKITVRVSGKNCTAEVEYILKPGVKEYRDYSTELKTMAYFSSLGIEYVTCVIE